MGRASFCHQLIAGFFNDMHTSSCVTSVGTKDKALSKISIRQLTNKGSLMTGHGCSLAMFVNLAEFLWPKLYFKGQIETFRRQETTK